MRTRLLALLTLLLASPVTEAFACAVCMGAPESKTTQSMATAIWVLMAIVMSVLGGVGMFGFHLWRQERMPLEPHQQLTQEDLDQYD
jgi:formate hydrogenlyase subunit 3/multisubunit Na+/H+ antiporter MnhD subunit